MHKNQIGNSRAKLAIYKKTLSGLTQKQKEISIGLLLGDVSIQTQNKGRTYRLKFEQGYNHKDYIDHLISVFDPWILSRPRLVIRMNKNKNVVQTWQCQTISHEAFNELAVLFLNAHSKKTIKSKIATYFTLSLAYWFMDDDGVRLYVKSSKSPGFEYTRVSNA
jgi:LAGLIDADG DNA endonuclease family